MPSILLRGGRVIDPARGVDATADVLVDGGLVRAISERPGQHTADVPLDCSGKLVLPGLVDPHVHLREPGQSHKETIASGAAAAIAGGFTTVCCMPNTDPAIDLPSTVEFVRMRANLARLARVFVAGAATVGRKGEQLAPMGAMRAAGAVAFTDDGDCIASAAMMGKVLSTCASLGVPFMQHCQDPDLTRGAAMHAGIVSARLGLGGWPSVAEEIIIERDVRLNRAYGCRYHVQHLSSAGSVEIVRRARAEGLPVSAEASPHHLLLTDEACDGYDTMAKVNPPLRTAADVAAVRAGVADGTIGVLATDHAPHTSAEKLRDFASAPFGLVGLETAFPLYVEALVESGAIPLTRLVELVTLAPARLLGLDARGIGRLEEGLPADITVIDPGAAWTVDPSAFLSRSRNTPFAGHRVRGRVTDVIVGGRRVLAEGAIAESAGAALGWC
jgi:dihydroorotase